VPAECFLALVSCLARRSVAQTIQVDTTPAHATNHFIPNQRLGAGLDRIPTEAIDKDLVQPNLDKALAAGWQTVTYRQNTELAVEAWHWNRRSPWKRSERRGILRRFVDSRRPDPRYGVNVSITYRCRWNMAATTLLEHSLRRWRGGPP
jgi:hypothetical protein